jgi:hypothetical protein
MRTVPELKAAFAVYFDEMDRCEGAATFWALLHIVLVLPDICAALERAPSDPVGDRYVGWCAANFLPNPVLTTGDRFQLRNAVRPLSQSGCSPWHDLPARQSWTTSHDALSTSSIDAR